MFNKQNYDKLVKSLKELDLSFKGIATNQANIKEKSFKDISAWDDYMNTVLDAFNTFSDRLSVIKKMFDDMDTDIDGMKAPLGSLVDDIKNLLIKTPKDIKLITELDKTIHEVYDVLTDQSADKSKYKDFLYVIPDTKNLVNINNFDNHHIIAAINKFNDFYKNEIIKNAGKDPNVIAKNSNAFKEAINELNKQFNVDIKINTNVKNLGMQTTPGKMRGGSSRQLTVSKTKGFDLGGVEIFIRSELYTDCIQMIRRSGKMIFGQVMCSSICHEIFHNISFMMLHGNSGPGKLLSAITSLTSAIFDTAMTIERAVSQFLAKLGIKSETVKYENMISIMIKNVTYSSYDKSLFKTICDKIFDKKIDEVSLREVDGIREIPIEELKKMPVNVKKIVTKVLTIGVLLLLALGRSVPTVIQIPAAIILGLNISSLLGGIPHFSHDNEESMADAFAAMYKLPVVFGDTALESKDGKNRFKYNNTDNKNDEHPATYDRSVVGYNMAKEILNSGEKINPELKEYLEFIVKEFNGVNKVERRFTKDQINKSAPEFNSNINSALNDFIAKHNISVTESSLIYDT